MVHGTNSQLHFKSIKATSKNSKLPRGEIKINVYLAQVELLQIRDSNIELEQAAYMDVQFMNV